jgi:signal transduction histidine kinase/ligand-binding sensor domain-containing protein
MQRTTIILAYLFICVNCYSQVQPFTPGYNFKHLNVQNGLVQNIVYHFLEDSRGYIWIGTHNGLTLYDGNRTINFLHNPQVSSSIAGNFITSILEDSSHNIWIGNENGIDLYHRKTNSFTHFGVDREDGTKENTYCVALGFINPTVLWFLDTKTKAIRSLNTETATTSFISKLNTNNALMYQGSSGQVLHIWSTYDKGTIHQVYKGNLLTKEETFFDGKSKIRNEPELEVIHVLQQDDSTTWLSTNKGLVKLNPLLNRYRVFDSWGDQTVRELRFTAITGNGQLWVGSGPDGIYVFDTKTHRFINNFRNDKFDPFTICSDNIVSLYSDRAGNIWCGSYGNGLSYTNTHNAFFSSHVSKKETQAWKGNNHISLLGATPDGNLWCTFENLIGFGLLDKNFKILKYQHPVMGDGTAYNQALYKLLFETNEEAWCITNRGLFLYNFKANKLRSVPYELISEEVQGSIWIKDIIRLNDGSILFSTFAGLYHLMKRPGKIELNPVNFLQPGVYNGFGKLAQDSKGLIYVNSLGDFIYILKPSTSRNQFELVRTIEFMPNVNQFFKDADSLLYMATDNGLYYFNTNNLALRKDKLDERIPFININSFFKEDEKYWLFGEKGLYCYDKKKNESRTFTIEDGLPANEFTSTIVLNKDGNCVAGTSNGLVSFFPGNVKNITNAPRAQLTAVYINDVLDTTSANSDEIKKLTLSSRQNTFSFDFSSISFFHTDECSFEYKLEGYDDRWVKSGVAHYTRYSKIPPGKYLFMLRVLDNQGKISPYDKLLEIEIAKSFWQTNFFKAMLIVFALLAGWLFLKWYSNEKIRKQMRELEKLKAIEKERTRIATDMHDDLGAGLSRIKFLSETIGIKKQQQQPFEEDIVKIREYSHEMIDKMGEIVWALNEKNDSLSDLLSYIRVYTVGYLSQHGINCKMEMPDNFSSRFVSGEFRRNIYLTIKEALHNVVKHAQASSVKIIIKINDKLEIRIADNGIGFAKHNIRPFSNGLTNMENRIKEIHGGFVILNEKGTVIKITVPLEI